jgi:hypothetical protein
MRLARRSRLQGKHLRAVARCQSRAVIVSPLPVARETRHNAPQYALLGSLPRHTQHNAERVRTHYSAPSAKANKCSGGGLYPQVIHRLATTQSVIYQQYPPHPQANKCSVRIFYLQPPTFFTCNHLYRSPVPSMDGPVATLLPERSAPPVEQDGP